MKMTCRRGRGSSRALAAVNHLMDCDCRGQLYETAERQRSQTLNTGLQGTLSAYSNTVALTDIQELRGETRLSGRAENHTLR